MTLGDVIKTYRMEHSLSMDEFAKCSGLSKGYISMLEKNRNPKTGKPIIPSILTYQSVAKAMSTSVDVLMKTVDKEQLVSLEQSPAPASDDLPDVSPTGQKIDARTRRQLEKVLEDDNLTYNGVVLNKEDREKVKKALELAFWDIKELNKRKKD